jgi:hypothetical protein
MSGTDRALPIRGADAAPELSTWSATMPTQPHPLDAPASRSRIAAFILIVGLGVLAVVAQAHPRNGSDLGPWTESVAEFGD